MLLAGCQLDILKTSPVNPAIALSTIIFNLSDTSAATIWIFCGISFLGSFLALIFFRKVYQATLEMEEDI